MTKKKEENDNAATITCPFCGNRYSEADSAVCCARCSLFGEGGCRKVRCPKCGYEMPPPARLPRLISGLVKKMTKRG